MLIVTLPVRQALERMLYDVTSHQTVYLKFGNKNIYPYPIWNDLGSLATEE